MGSVLPSLTHTQQQQGLQGILWSLSLFRRERQHTNPSKGDLNVTLHWPLWDLSAVICSATESWGGSWLGQDCRVLLRAERQFLNNLTKARMSRLPKQWKFRLFFYLFFSELMVEDHRQELASLCTDSFTTCQPAAHMKVIWSRRVCSFLLSYISLLTFYICLWFDSWSACRVVSRAEGLTRQMFNRGSNKR